eukprot:205000_1
MFIEDGITQPTELWYNLKGENHVHFYFDNIMTQYNELQGQRFNLLGYNTRIRLGEFCMDHVALGYLMHIAKNDPFSYLEREYWLTLRVGGNSKTIHFALEWLCNLYKWSEKDNKEFYQDWKKVNNKTPTKTTIKDRRKFQKLICASTPIRQPLVMNYDNINLANTFLKISGMHDSIYIIWAVKMLVLPYLPKSLPTQLIIAKISGMNPGENVTQSIKTLREILTLLLSIVPYFEMSNDLVLRQASYGIVAAQFIVNECLYKTKPLDAFTIAL